MVSIILPNLNTPLEFLSPRITSIIKQTFADWECIVIDGFSDNGSWEMIHEKTAGDKRFFYYQKPAKGIYDAWNEGIKLAKGEYIYIATSDDLCDPDFLNEMVKALNANPDCSLAHCCLNIIDENGNPTPYQWSDWEKVKFYGDYIQKPHKRLAPYDAIVHFGWNTVYTSIVQLLLRKDLFEQIGYFSTNYGTVADFEWELRASLCANLVHVPLYLASWRRHKNQASQVEFINSPEFCSILITMAHDALTGINCNQRPELSDIKELYFNYHFNQFNITAKNKKINFLAENFIKMPYLTVKVLIYRLFKIKFDTSSFLKKQLAKRNLHKLLYEIQ